MPKDKKENKVYKQYSLPKDTKTKEAIMADLKARIEKLESSGKLSKGYGEKVVPLVDIIANDDLYMWEMTAEEWKRYAPEYHEDVSKLFYEIGVEKNDIKIDNVHEKMQIDSYYTEELSLIYAIVEEAENGRDLSSQRKIDVFYKRQFQSNYAPNVEFEEKVDQYAKDLDSILNEQVNHLNNFQGSNLHARIEIEDLERKRNNDFNIGDLYIEINESKPIKVQDPDNNSKKLFYENRDVQRKKLDTVIEQFDKENKMEADVQADLAKILAFEEAKRNVNIELDTNNHDVIKDTILSHLHNIERIRSVLSKNIRKYEDAFEEYEKKYQEIEKDLLTQDRDKKMTDLHNEFVKYQEQYQKDNTFGFEIMQELYDQINLIREHSSKADRYTTDSIEEKNFIRSKELKEIFDKKIENHEKLLEENSNKYKRRIQEFDDKWNRTADELRDAINVGYSMIADYDNELSNDMGASDVIINANPENIKEYGVKYGKFIKNVALQRELVSQKKEQFMKLADEREQLIKDTGDKSINDKYDLDRVSLDGVNDYPTILDKSEDIQSSLFNEKSYLREQIDKARLDASEFYHRLRSKAGHDTLIRESEEENFQEAEKERKRVNRVFKEVKEKLKLIDEEMEKMPQRGYSEQDTLKYLNDLVKDLDRKQQDEVLEAYGMDKEEREKFHNEKTDLLSFLNKSEKGSASNDKKDTHNNEQKAQKENKDLSVALTTRQGLFNLINKNDEKIYFDLKKRYEDVKTGNYSDKEKEEKYVKFEKEIKIAKDSQKLNRGQLRLSERVCKFLALGQKIELPEFEIDRLTILEEAIKNRILVAEVSDHVSLQDENIKEVQEKTDNKPDTVKESPVKAAPQKKLSKEEQEKIGKQLKSIREELTKVIDDTEKIGKEIDNLRQDANKVIGDKEKPSGFIQYKNYYKSRLEKLTDFHFKLEKQKDEQYKNFNKMKKLRQDLDELVEQTADSETKRQLDELVERHERLENERETAAGDDLDDALNNERDRLEIENRTLSNNRVKDKLKEASNFADEWLKKYEQSFYEPDLGKQIETLKELKASFDKNKNIMPPEKVINKVLEKTEMVLGYDGKFVEQDVVSRKDEEFINYNKYAKALMDLAREEANGIDTMITNVEAELKAAGLKNKLEDDYKSFVELNNPEQTKDELAGNFQNKLKEYLEKVSYGSDEYGEDDRKEARKGLLDSSKQYLEHLNQKFEGENAREALRAYQEKTVLQGMLQTMVQLPEFYAEDELEEKIESEKNRSTSDKKKAEEAIAKLKAENTKISENIKKEQNNLFDYVNVQNDSLNQILKNTEKLGDISASFDEKESAVSAMDEEAKRIKESQEKADKEFEDAKDKVYPNDKKILLDNKAEKSDLANAENIINEKIEALREERNNLEVSVKDIAKNELTQKDAFLGKEKDKINDFVNASRNSIDEVQHKLNTKISDVGKAEDAEGLTGLAEVTKTYDFQVEAQEKLKVLSDELHDQFKERTEKFTRSYNEIEQFHKNAAGKIKSIDENIAATEFEYNTLNEKLKYTTERQEALKVELKQKQHEDKIRREIKDAFDAVKDTRDRGIGSHAKFNEFKAAMQTYLENHPDGHPNDALTPENLSQLSDSAYQSCIAYVTRHLKVGKGLQSIGHQGTDEGALRKQGTVRILELMKELPEFKNKFELTAENPQIAEEPKAKDEAKDAKNDEKNKNDKNDKRVKLNFEQLKSSLGENSKRAKTKKKGEYSKNAYADLNAAISNRVNNENKEEKGKKR